MKVGLFEKVLLPLTCFFFITAIAQNKKESIVDTLYAIYNVQGVDAIAKAYQELSPEKFDKGRFQIMSLAQKIQSMGKLNDAFVVFSMNVELFPKSTVPFYNYGDILSELGQRNRAIESYKRGLENLAGDSTLNPAQERYFSLVGNWGLNRLESFNHVYPADLNYHVYHGGALAGWWDTQNLIAFKEKEEIANIGYENFDIYNAPVPTGALKSFAVDTVHIVSIFNGWTYLSHVENNKVVALDSLWEAEGWSKQFPTSIAKAVTHGNKIYMVPEAFQLNPVYYRKSVLDSLGLEPPTTWHGLLKLCDDIHNAGLIPFTISAKGWPPPVARWFTILNLRLNGFEFHKDLLHGDVAWTDPRVKNVFLHWKQLFDHHAFAIGSENNSWNVASNEFYSKKAAMYNIGEWIFESPNNDALLKDVDFFTIPVLSPDVASAEIFHLYGTMLLNEGKLNEKGIQLLRYKASSTSQGSNLKRLETRTPSNRKLYHQMSNLQQRQYDLVRNTEHLVPLFEFGPKPEFISFALGIFLEFWEDQNDIDSLLNKLEKKKQEVFALN